MGYEYYEFRRIDGALTDDERSQLDQISSRFSPSRRGISFEYNYSDIKADPAELVRNYFDFGLHVSKYGRRRLLLRLSANETIKDVLHNYLVPEAVEIVYDSDSLILDADVATEHLAGWIHSGEGLLDPLIPLREELSSGDIRPAYLFWLAGIGSISANVPGDAEEPPVPPGLGELTDAQQSLCDFFGFSNDRLAPALAYSGEDAALTSTDWEKFVDALSGSAAKRLLKDVVTDKMTVTALRSQLLNQSKDDLLQRGISTGRTVDQYWHHVHYGVPSDSTSQRALANTPYLQLLESLGLAGYDEELDLGDVISGFCDRSWDGDWYAPFSINSRNFRHIPAETTQWFELMGLAFQAVLERAEEEPGEAFALLRRLLKFFYEALASDQVVFADELGEWMLPRNTPDLIGEYLELIPEDYSPEERVEAIEVVKWRLSPLQRFQFYVDCGDRERAFSEVASARASKLEEMLKLADEGMDDSFLENLARHAFVENRRSEQVAITFIEKRLRESGRSEEMVDLRRKRFERWPSRESLQEYRSVALEHEGWEELKLPALQTLRDQSPREYIRWHIEQGDAAEAIALWEEIGRPKALADLIAEAASDVDPDLVLKIRLPRVHEAIGRKRRHFYRQACKELNAIKKALQNAGRQKEWEEVLDSVLNRYDTYAAFQRVAADAGLK